MEEELVTNVELAMADICIDETDATNGTDAMISVNEIVNINVVDTETRLENELAASIKVYDTMMNMKVGFIYLITCRDEEKKYVGQTTKTMASRWAKHVAYARLYIYHKDEDEEFLANRGILRSQIYGAMAKFGIDRFEMSMLERCECETDEELQDMLNSREVFWIDHYDCIYPKGHNLQKGGLANGAHSEISIARISATKRANVDNYRHPKLAGLPPYLSYRQPDQGEAIRIAHHPYCAHMTFSVKKYGSWEAAKAACQAHYRTLPPIPEPSIENDCDAVVSHEKRLIGGRHGATYITKARNGYKVRIGKDSGSTVYFTDKTKTSQENYELAVAYRDAKLLERSQTKLNVQRLDTNGVDMKDEIVIEDVQSLAKLVDEMRILFTKLRTTVETILSSRDDIIADMVAKIMEIMSSKYCNLFSFRLKV